ncbi:MAG: hypothetical protein AAFN41_09235 [Planctomycetota bacterium]
MNRMTVNGLLTGLAVGSAAVLCAAGAGAQETQAEQPTPIAVADLPSVEEVMELHLDGIGGEDAVRAVTSRRFTGRVSVFVGGQEEPLQVGRLEMSAKAPDTLVQDMIFPGRNSARTIVQDGVVWQINDNDEPEKADEAAAGRQRASARFYQLADWREMFTNTEVLGGVSQGDRRAVQVGVTHLDGRKEVYTFDLDSGLLLLIGGERPSPVNAAEIVPFRRAYEDYRDVEGVLYPHRVVEQAGPVAFEILVNEIEVGVDVPTFEVPDFSETDTGE